MDMREMFGMMGRGAAYVLSPEGCCEAARAGRGLGAVKVLFWLAASVAFGLCLGRLG